jgi:hypothetical protein
MRLLWAVAAIGVASYPIQVQAFSFTEVGDAGDTLSTAQVISGSSSLTSISGSLSGFDDAADLFQIALTGGQSFSATTVGGASFDTRLFLFAANGTGVYFNDDAAIDTLQSTLPANSSFTPTQSGIYYLGIAGFDSAPVNAAGDRIFPSVNDFSVDVPQEDIFTGVFGPTGPGGSLPLSVFDGLILNEGGSYTIALTGAEAVPEPVSTLGLILAGASGIGLRLKNKRGQA